MHPNTVFRKTTNADNLAFVRARSFGTLCVNAEEGPLLAHIPFVLTDDNTHADFHLVRSNPIARMPPEQTVVVLSVTGPDSFISPDWYEIDDQVPTWNYVAVHLRGILEQRPASDLRPHLDRLSAQFEARLAPKKPWTTDKMGAQTLEKMMRMIVPFRLKIQNVQGTWKLAQNKPDAARNTAATHVEMHGIGQETAQLADLMQHPPKS
ncbi:MAG: FMN-binding negative transcriptional regulator [Paracoccaceae bacterium]